MLIYVIDDEPIVLKGAERVIREAAPEEEILCFSDGEAALAALEDGEMQSLLARQYFDIARMSSRPLEKEELSRFIANSYKIAAKVSDRQ